MTNSKVIVYKALSGRFPASRRDFALAAPRLLIPCNLNNAEVWRHPASRCVGARASVEAVGGMLYVTIIMARLVNLYAQDAS